ncbi:MAG: hypothetical protein AB8B64_10450 [Granulosicoccus sp.]
MRTSLPETRRRPSAALSFGTMILLMLSSMASANSFILQPNQWNNIVIPADPAGMSVGELFGDDMLNSHGESLAFSSEWVVYAYDPSIGDYRRPASEDYAPAAGEAMWIFHISDIPVTLDIPTELQVPPPSMLSTGCASDEGCFDIILPSDPAWPTGIVGQRYSMQGLPYPYKSVLADWSLTTDAMDSACTDGCNIDAAAAVGYTATNVWYYQYAEDGSASYAEPGSSDILPPWQGYWIATGGPAESLQPKLQLPISPTLSTISGRVTTSDGLPVTSASILADSGSDSIVTMTDAEGRFLMSLVADTIYRLNIDSDEHASQLKVVKSPLQDEFLNLEFTLQPTQLSGIPISHNDPADINGFNGSRVTLQPNSFVDSDGQIITGPVLLSMTSVDVSNPADLAAFPGDFVGRTETGVDSPIVSLGVTNFEFTTPDGTPVQLAEGAEATILIPVYAERYPDGTPVMVGDNIPLWSLDEETGQWIQEGEGTVVGNEDSPTGLSLQATVSHFSWWNCDVTLNAVPVQILVTGSSSGTALINATASQDLGWRPDTVTTVVAIGDTTRPLFVPNGIEVCYSADLTYQNGSTASTDRPCFTFTSTIPPLPIVLTAPDTSSVLALQTSITPFEGELQVGGFVGGALERVQISTLSAETDVTYSIIDGELPNGVELRKVNDTRAELAGIPVEAGIFSVLVQGSNEMAETDSIRISIDIQLDAPPPSLPQSIEAEIFPQFEQNTVSLESYNTGGPATSWQLDSPLPSGMILNQSGTIEIPYELLFNSLPGALDWSGTVTASNDSGSSSSALTLTVFNDDIILSANPSD